MRRENLDVYGKSRNPIRNPEIQLEIQKSTRNLEIHVEIRKSTGHEMDFEISYAKLDCIGSLERWTFTVNS